MKKEEITEKEYIKNTLFYQCCELKKAVAKFWEAIIAEFKKLDKQIKGEKNV